MLHKLQITHDALHPRSYVCRLREKMRKARRGCVVKGRESRGKPFSEKFQAKKREEIRNVWFARGEDYLST